jgi:hypothetical protein
MLRSRRHIGLPGLRRSLAGPAGMDMWTVAEDLASPVAVRRGGHWGLAVVWSAVVLQTIVDKVMLTEVAEAQSLVNPWYWFCVCPVVEEAA